MSPTVLEGAIRCGCTHLIVDLLLTAEEASQVAAAPRLAAAVRHLRQPDHWPRLGAPPAIVVRQRSREAVAVAAQMSSDARAQMLICSSPVRSLAGRTACPPEA